MTSSNNKVIFEALYPGVIFPQRATTGAAGYDVRVYLEGRTVNVMVGSRTKETLVCQNELVLYPGERAAVPLGFRASLPVGLEAQLRLRSSVAFNKGLVIPNSPATVDPDYPGEWLLLLANGIEEPIVIQHLERIAQIIFSRFEVVEWERGCVVTTSNRMGGLGSTGP